MKRTMGAFKCNEHEAILEVWSEADGKAIQELSCLRLGESGTRVSRSCLPAEGSKYISCQSFQCPDGYYPAVAHMKDEESGRQGLGFQCVPVEPRRATGSLWDRLFGDWDTIPG
ncbi:MAG: hypothetical protein ACUVS3_06520 [Thermodesulfobacteriota bacterium]